MIKLTTILLELKKEEFTKVNESTISSKHKEFRKNVKRGNLEMEKTLSLLKSYKSERT
jgi:hypothetical protein